MTYFHHILIHFPIAFGIGAMVFSVMGAFMKDLFGQKTVFLLLSAGAIITVLTAVTGLFSAGHWSDDLIGNHRTAAIVTSILYLSAGSWAATKLIRNQKVTQSILIIVCIVIALAVGITGHLGGSMVHPGISFISESDHDHGQSNHNESEHEH